MPGEKQRKRHEKLKTDEEATAGNLCCKIDKKNYKRLLEIQEIADVYDLSKIWGRKEKKNRRKNVSWKSQSEKKKMVIGLYLMLRGVWFGFLIAHLDNSHLHLG